MAHEAVRRVTSTAFGLALVGAVGVVVGVANTAQADSDRNITICHATGAEGKWNVITVDAASIVNDTGQAQGGRNVIPPFTYVVKNTGAQLSYPGLNWIDNWAVDGNGVALQDVDPTDCLGPDVSLPTPSVTSTPSVSVTPTETSTPAPSVSVTPTQTSTPTPSVSVTPVETSTPTPSVSVTATETSTPTATSTPTGSSVPTPSVSVTPTETATSTGTATPTPSVSVTPTGTATSTATATPTPSVSVTPTETQAPAPSTTVTPTGPASQPDVTGPVVETDLIGTRGPNVGLVGGGALLLLVGAGATLLGSRRRGSHS